MNDKDDIEDDDEDEGDDDDDGDVHDGYIWSVTANVNKFYIFNIYKIIAYWEFPSYP
jgi:hypothetical protein